MASSAFPFPSLSISLGDHCHTCLVILPHRCLLTRLPDFSTQECQAQPGVLRRQQERSWGEAGEGQVPVSRSQGAVESPTVGSENWRAVKALRAWKRGTPGHGPSLPQPSGPKSLSTAGNAGGAWGPREPRGTGAGEHHGSVWTATRVTVTWDKIQKPQEPGKQPKDGRGLKVKSG